MPHDAVTDALVTQWQVIADLAADLTDEQWHAASILPGWSNGDIVAHIIGTESMLDGRDVAAIRDVAALAHVHNPIGELNERWIDHFRAAPPAEVRAALGEIVAARTTALRAMSQEDFDVETATPAGMDSYGRFMRIRIFDCWMHEVDLRESTDGWPTSAMADDDGSPAAWAVDEIAASLPFVVGKRAGAPEGTTVIIDLTGAAARRIRIAVIGRAGLVAAFDDGDASADVTLTLDTIDLARLVGGRSTADPASVAISGDAALGERIVGALDYVI